LDSFCDINDIELSVNNGHIEGTVSADGGIELFNTPEIINRFEMQMIDN